MADPPKIVTMPNGETVYVTGWQPTIRAIRSGSWINPLTWDLGRVPTLNDRVWIPDDFAVTLHDECYCEKLVCGGMLPILHGTILECSSIFGLPGAHLVAGTLHERIGWTWEHISRPFEPEDTQQIGNGLVWCGHGRHHAVQIYGYGPAWNKPGDAMAVPTGKRGGTHYPPRTEVPSGVEAYSLGNSITFTHVHGAIKPHVMLMHATGVIEGVSLIGFGRTDKSQVLSATNPAGRYALHFHRGGEVHESRVRWCASTGSDGWGIVNHSSNVVVEDSIVADAFGAGFVGEAANEKGAFRRCVAVDIKSNLEPNPYERQLANDRWHAGEGFAVGPLIEVSDCRSIDVGMCFAWQCRGLQESISGQGFTHEAKFADGTPPHLVKTLPVKNLYGSGYSRFGVWSQWKNFRLGMTPISNVRLIHGGPKSQAFRTSYDGGWHAKNVTIDGADIGSFEESLDHFAEMRFESCDVRNVRQGTESLESSMHKSTWHKCGVRAREAGILCRPSKHPACQRIYTLTDTTIEAPTPVRLIDPGAPYTDYQAANVTNEVWKDGVRLKYPWQ